MRLKHAVLLPLLLLPPLCLAVLPSESLASSSVPPKSLRALSGRPLWVPLCSRRGVNGSAAWFDAVNTAVMDQQACISPSWGTVTALKLVFAAFDVAQQGEIDRNVTATGTAAIFVPGANTVTVFGGTGVASGSTMLNSFQATGLGANGISLGQSISSSGGGIASGAYVASVADGFATGSGNTPTSLTVTMNTGTTANTANGQPFVFTGLLVPVKFGGARNFTISPAHDVVTSDPTSAELAPSTWFMVRTSAVMSAPGMQLMDVPVGARMTINSAGGNFIEFDNRSTTLNDQTLNPSGLANTGGGYWGPVMLLGQVTPLSSATPPGAVLVLGDSIAAGTGDTPDSLGYEGYIQRSFENNIPFVTAARGSTTAFAEAAHSDGQYALSIDTGITDVLMELGRNDIEQFSLTAAELEGSVASIATRYRNAGKRVWCFTVPPTTYSSDGWLSLPNQAFPYSVNTLGSSGAVAGSSVLNMSSVANISVGLQVSLNGSSAAGIAPGTTVTAVNTTNSTITLSSATTAALSGSIQIYFGTNRSSASPVETQRQAYNAFLRSSSSNLGCFGLIDVDSVMSDPAGSGKWRTDLGAASLDGVHPSTVLHQAVINAGLISTAKFQVP